MVEFRFDFSDVIRTLKMLSHSRRNSLMFALLLILVLFVLKSTIWWARYSIVKDAHIAESGTLSATYRDRISSSLSTVDKENHYGLNNHLGNGKSNWRVIPKVEYEAIPKLTEDDVIYKWHMDSGAIINEEYKLIFFSVAKAASSEWKLFLMRLSGLPTVKWCHLKTVHKGEINHFKHLRDYTLGEAQEMMTSSEWTRAIFVRHPKPRVLSAFLDKAVRMKRVYKRSCYTFSKLSTLREKMNKGDSNQTNATETNEMYMEECLRRHDDFGFFLHNITTTKSMNEHWRSSMSYIDEKWWPWITYVGIVENGREDVVSLLKSIKSSKDGVSAWDRIGKTGWSGQERMGVCNGTDAFLDNGGNNGHATHARDKMLQYYTPELERFVEEHYADDLNNLYFDVGNVKLFEEDDSF